MPPAVPSALCTAPLIGAVVVAGTGIVVDWDQADWDQAASADGDQPERPAPTLALSPKKGGAHSHGAGGDMVTTASEASGAAADSTGSDATARWLGGAGLARGALALALAIGNTLRRRSS